MSPITHLLASWIVARKATNNLRDCRLVTLAGIVPDLDGLGLGVDLATNVLGLAPTAFYQDYHHYLLHGVFGAVVTAGAFAMLARQRLRTALLVLVTFHLHIVCDFVGSRGPTADDIWPIFYFGPFSKEPMWMWANQWSLDGWQNKGFSVALLAWSFALAIRQGESIVRIFSQRADAAFVQVLRNWYDSLRNLILRNKPQTPRS